MPKPLYIYNAGHFYHELPATVPAPNLKATLQAAAGNKIRRIDRLTQLALIGSFHCRAESILPDNTGLYLSSVSGPLTNTRTVLAEIYQNGELPRPLNFINAVSNSACFHLAEQLGLTSYNQFVTREYFTLEATLKLAQIDLDVGNVDAALVGIVCEAGKVFDAQTDAPPQAEGSFWLYIGNNESHKKPIAKITHVIEPLSKEALLDQLPTLLTTHHQVDSQIAFGQKVTNDDKQLFAEATSLNHYVYTPSSIANELHTAAQINHFVAACQTNTVPTRLVYIDIDKGGRYCFVNLEHCPP